MKQMITALCALMLSAPAFANGNSNSFKHIALCEMETEVEDGQKDLLTISEIAVKEAISLNPSLLKLVNIHLQHQQYTTSDLSLEQVKELFTTGIYRHDDLYIVSMQAKSTGRIYYHVLSYPGDNQYGLFFTLEGKLVANDQDGTVSLYVGNTGKDVSCDNL